MSRDLIQQEIASLSPTQESNEEDLAQEAAPVRIPPAFFALAALAFLLLLGIGIFLASGGRDRDSRAQREERSRENQLSIQENKEEARNIIEKLTTAMQNYSSARTIEEKLAYVRRPEQAEPLMRDYYAKHELVPQEGAKLISQHALSIASSSFIILTATLPEGNQLNLLAEIDDDLNVTIDWESDVCYQSVDVSDYIKEKPSEPASLRVLAQIDNFYVYEFADSEKYQCLKLTFRDNNEHLFAYIERDSEDYQKIFHNFQVAQKAGKTTPEPLFLKVRFLANSKSERSVLIEELIAPRWPIIVEKQPNE